MKSSSAVSFLRKVTVSWAKCITAIRIGLRMLFSASPQPEPHAGPRQATGHADRRTIGAPTSGAAQRSVFVEFDAVHAAAARRHRHDLVAHPREFGDHALR